MGALADLRTAGETQVTWDWAFPPNSWKNKPAGLGHLRPLYAIANTQLSAPTSAMPHTVIKHDQ